MKKVDEFRVRLLRAFGAKNSWGKNEISDMITSQYIQMLEKELGAYVKNSGKELGNEAATQATQACSI